MLKKKIAILMALVMMLSVVAVANAASGTQEFTRVPLPRWCTGCCVGLGAFDETNDETNDATPGVIPDLDLTAYNILVSPTGSDNIGMILAQLGVSFHQMALSEMPLIATDTPQNRTWVNQFDAIFINCGRNMNGALARQFVAQGGLLYVSDLAISTLRNAFPEWGLNWRSNTSPFLGNIQILDQALVNRLEGDSVPVYWDLGSYILLRDWNRAIPHSVVAVGPGSGSDDTYYHIVTFEHGEGRAFFISFHVRAQMTDETAVILEFLASWIQDHGLWTPLINIGNTLGLNQVSAPMTGELESGDCQTFEFDIEAGTDFAILNNGSTLNNFTMTLVAPDGTPFEASSTDEVAPVGVHQGMTIYSLGVAGMAVRAAQEGVWTFTITSTGPGTARFVIAIATGTLVPNVALAMAAAEPPTVVPIQFFRWSTDRGPIIPFPALNRSEPTGMVTIDANGGLVEVQARVSTDRISLVIPISPRTTMNALLYEASNDTVTFDISEFEDTTAVVITRAALRTFANAGVTLQFNGADGVAEVNPAIELNSRGTGGIVINLNFE